MLILLPYNTDIYIVSFAAVDFLLVLLNALVYSQFSLFFLSNIFNVLLQFLGVTESNYSMR